MNYVNLIGKMTKPALFHESNGRRTAHFTLTTHETVLDESGNPKNITESHRMYAWGNWVTVLENLGEAGIQLAVEGKLKHRFYSAGGRRQCFSEVEVNDLIIL